MWRYHYAILLVLVFSKTDSFLYPTRLNRVVSSSQPSPAATFVNPGDRRRIHDSNNEGSVTPSSTALYMAKLWDRLGIEEDDEPMWYVLNCVAGLEIDLLRQCRQRCEGMEDVVKFVVPTEKKTRSHGASRMVTETKVKYQGYVFAKLRLCPETYQAVQGLDLCRSWMGTVNHKGYKKLPPAPVCLNEEEIENFGLEDIEFEEEDDTGEEEEGIIVDTAEKDFEEAKTEAETLKVYKGLRVEDMVKVTARNKFFNEDGIVKRLKEGKIYVRFYTYGTMYDEWLDPGDVRKLSNEEILRGLSGPSQPVTQRDIDGPPPGERYGYQDGPGGRPRNDSDMRRSLMDNVRGGPGGPGQRNRRQDRTADRFRSNRYEDDRRNEENWNWYKENQRRNQGGGYSDGDVDIRGSSPRNDGNRRDRSWAQGDVDSQWGRGNQRSPRQNTRENTRENTRQNTRENTRQTNARNNDSNGRARANTQNDWSSFVSPASSAVPKAETEDFFDSLMSDLSKGLNGDSGGGSRGKGSTSTSDEDDFFASLMSEISETGGDGNVVDGSSRDSGGDDLFGTFQEDRYTDSSGKKDEDDMFGFLDGMSDASSMDGEDDFFASIEADLKSSKKKTPPKKQQQEQLRQSTSDEDDFFASLQAELGDSMFDDQEASMDMNQEADDFFASLEKSVSSDLGEVPVEAKQSSGRSRAKKDAPEPSSSMKSTDEVTSSATSKEHPKSQSMDPTSLNELTVPALKNMLRERGMKVSGTKAALIERLSSR